MRMSADHQWLILQQDLKVSEGVRKSPPNLLEDRRTTEFQNHLEGDLMIYIIVVVEVKDLVIV